MGQLVLPCATRAAKSAAVASNAAWIQRSWVGNASAPTRLARTAARLCRRCTERFPSIRPPIEKFGLREVQFAEFGGRDADGVPRDNPVATVQGLTSRWQHSDQQSACWPAGQGIDGKSARAGAGRAPVHVHTGR